MNRKRPVSQANSEVDKKPNSSSLSSFLFHHSASLNRHQDSAFSSKRRSIEFSRTNSLLSFRSQSYRLCLILYCTPESAVIFSQQGAVTIALLIHCIVISIRFLRHHSSCRIIHTTIRAPAAPAGPHLLHPQPPPWPESWVAYQSTKRKVCPRTLL